MDGIKEKDETKNNNARAKISINEINKKNVVKIPSSK